MRKILFTALLCGTLATMQLYGRSIGVNFVSEYGSQAALGATEEAGVISQVNWNNSIVLTQTADGTGLAASGTTEDIASPTAGVIVDDSAAATGVEIEWLSSNSWGQGATPATPDQKLLDGYLDANPEQALINLFNIPYELYDLIIYVGSDGNGRNGSTMIDYEPSSEIFYITDSNWSGGGFGGTFVQATATLEDDAVPSHYTIYKNQTNATVTIENWRSITQDMNVGLHGIQIVEILDNDNDGMLDSWELKNGLDPTNPADAAQDADEDGLTNLEEFNLNFDPQDPDMDDDELLDGREVELGANPRVQDTDRDGILDGPEDQQGLDPTKQDTDGDEYTDPFELANGSDPTDVNSVPTDLDEAVSINFIGGYNAIDGGTVTGVAGVEQRPNWNNVAPVDVPTGGPVALIDDSGSDSGLSLTWSGSPNTWAITNNAPADQNAALMNGYLDTNATSTTTAEVTNISYEIYDVIVYFDRDAVNSVGQYSANDRVHKTLVPSPGWPVTAGNGVFIEANLPNEAGNYTVFTNMKGSTLQVQAFPENFRAPLNGIQIVNTPDTDGDGISDRVELSVGLNPEDASDAAGDLDEDGLTNLEEADLGLMIDVADYDQDGLGDGGELEIGSDLFNPDTDADGLLDGGEYTAGTDATNPDTDGDLYTDYVEVMLGSDPTDVNSTPQPTTIGINMIGGYNDTAGGNVSGTAGVILQGNWNNIGDYATPAGGPAALVDDSGADSGATVTWTGSPNTWAVADPAANTPADPDGDMMNGYLDTNGTSTTTVVVENLSLETYGVIIYMDGDGTNNIGSYTVNGENKLIRDQNANWPVVAGGRTYRLSKGTSDAGNYAIWENLTGSTLTITATPAQGGTRAPINGIQIFEYTGSGGGGTPVITSIMKVDGADQLTIMFESEAGQSYTIQGSDEASAGFENITTGIAATGDMTEITVDIDPGAAAQFYKIILE